MNKTSTITFLCVFLFLKIFANDLDTPTQTKINTIQSIDPYSQAATFIVSSQEEFEDAEKSATAGDVIEWVNGIYSDIFMDIDPSGVIVRAQTLGEVVFTGASRTIIDGSDVTFIGFQYVGGNILVEGSTSTQDQTIITVDGSNVNISQLNFSAYTCWKYLRIRDSSQYTNVSYCNFENRINYADQNIFQIDVAADQPGFHNISFCSFKNFTGDPLNDTNGDDGVEPIRVGSSSQSLRSSRTTVEYCYFTSCNGDDEIISGKATDCVYRYNTLEANNGEIVLRHGNRGIVYGNFFINNEAGVRVREGSDHIIYNNYFSGLTDKSIDLQASSGDRRVQNVTIANNTFVDTDNIDLGDGNELNDPLNTLLINNVFQNTTSSNHFRTPTGTEIWYGNIVDLEEDLGLDATPSTGITFDNPGLVLNSEGFYQVTETSPVVNTAVENEVFPFPLIDGLAYDNTIDLDLLTNDRDSLKDVGAQEFSATAKVAPHVSEDNTGPSYLMPGNEPLEPLLSILEIDMFEADGGTNLLNIIANVDWTATVDQNGGWLSLNKTNGSNVDTIEVTAEPNTGDQRSTTITLFGEGGLTVFVQVTQNITPELSVLYFPQFNFNGGTNVLNVRSNINWTVSEDVDWLTLRTNNGSNNGNIEVTALQNFGEERNAIITLSGADLTVLVEVFQTKSTVVVQSTKSLEVSDTSESIVVYPNPVQSELTVINAADSIIYIYDENGQLLLQQSLLNNTETINLNNLSNGVFFSQIKGNQKNTVKKIVKE